MITDIYTIYIWINDAWVQCPSNIMDNFSKEEILYNDLSPSASCVKATFKPDISFYNSLRSITGYPRIKITKNGSTYFVGYLRINYEIVKTQQLQPLEVEICSSYYLLENKNSSAINLYNYYVSNNSDTSHSILHTLLGLVGITSYTLPNIPVQIPIYSVEEDSSKFTELLSKLLFEYNYVYTFDDAGTFILKELILTSFPTPTQVFNGSNIRGSIKQTKTEETYEKIKVQWESTKTLSNKIVYQDTTDAGNGYACNITINPSSYWGEDEDWETSKYEVEEGEVLGAYDLTLNITKDTDIEIKKQELGHRTSVFSFYNNSNTFSRYIHKLNVVAGTVIVSTGTNLSEYVRVAGTQKILSYESKYIFDKAHADTLVSNLNNYYQYSDFAYELSSLTDYPLGSCVQVSETGIGTAICRIIRKMIDEKTGLITYTLEGVSEWTVAETIDTTSSGTNTVYTSINRAILNISGPVNYTIQNVIYGDSYTTTPSQLTLSYIAQLKAIVLKWDKQANLSNLDHYELQVSADNTSWYSLCFDRTSYKTGNAGEYYSTTNNQVVHTLPSTDGTIQSYYYRVRQYTRAGAYSAYSTAVLASTSLLDNGDFSANEVYANIVSASSINAGIANISDSIQITEGGFSGQNYDNTKIPPLGARSAFLDGDEVTIKIFQASSDPDWVDNSFTLDFSPLDSSSYQARARYMKLWSNDENYYYELIAGSPTYVYEFVRGNNGKWKKNNVYTIPTITHSYYTYGYVYNGYVYMIECDYDSQNITYTNYFVKYNLSAGTKSDDVELTTAYGFSSAGLATNSADTWCSPFLLNNGALYFSSHLVTNNLLRLNLADDTITYAAKSLVYASNISRFINISDNNFIVRLSTVMYPVSVSNGVMTIGSQVSNGGQPVQAATSVIKYNDNTMIDIYYVQAYNGDSTFSYNYYTISGTSITLTNSEVRKVDNTYLPTSMQNYATRKYAFKFTDDNFIYFICDPSTTTSNYWWMVKYSVDTTAHTITPVAGSDISSYRECFGHSRMVYYSRYFEFIRSSMTGYNNILFGHYGVWVDDLVIGRGTNTIKAGAIKPTATDTYDIGSVSNKYKNVYVSGSISAASLTTSGAVSSDSLSTGSISATGTISGSTVTGTNIRIPTSQPTNLANGDIWMV